MSQTIQIKRGIKANLPTLNNGEFALTTDTKDVYVGTPTGNELVGGKTVNESLADITTIVKVTKNTDITSILNLAFASMQEGETIKIPKGNYFITNVVFDPPNNCTLVCDGVLKSNATTGVAFKIGNDSTSKMGYHIKGLNVQYPTINWANGVTGIQIVNTNDSDIAIKRVFGFNKNIEILGTSGNGTSYNRFYISRSDAGKKSLFLTANNNGWCNENSFYGGEFSYISTNGTLDNDCVLITIDHYAVHQLNNNHFYSPSLEGNSSGLGKAAVIEGTFNQILYARTELIGNIELTVNSSRNNINVGYDDFVVNRITDNGQGNSIRTPRQTKYSSDADEVLSVRNYGTGTNKNFVSRDVAGTIRYYVTADGVMHSDQHAYFQNGIRWRTSSGTETDRGLFQGVGSPEGVVTAEPGSMYLSATGGTGTTLYIKESGGGNTGWVAK